MPRQPRISGSEAVRALQRAGWQITRQRGSHVLLVHPSRVKRIVTVPIHAGRILKPKTLASILDLAGLSVDDLRGLV
jgi:predicted RNA binding protein YcfA (HicA-like mRNA interferase family)